MTPTTKSTRRAAAERVAAQRAAQQRAARKRNLLMAGGGIVAVILVIVGIVVVGLHTKKGTGSSDVTPASSAVTQAIANVATSAMVAPPNLSTIAGPPTALTGDALKASNGLPQVLYVSAEWCPNCAATRWPLAIALSRFGTFTGISTTYSSSTDQPSHLPTLSFRTSTYKSRYIDFAGKEQVDGNNKPLQKLTAAESAIFEKLGGTASNPQPGYPFIDFGGKWKQNGTSYDPTILAGMTPDQVAAAMTNANTKQGAAIQASADVFTAEICDLTGGKPANVCTATGVAAGTNALASLKK